jgi:hypothetical protein
MVSNSSVVAHSKPDANLVVQRYLAAFTENSSILVAPKSKLASLQSAAWLADCCTTDCTSTFEGGRCSTDELVIESSGTTGQPKLIRYRKQTLRECATAIAESLPLTVQREAYVSVVNPRLAYGLSIMHSHLSAGVPVTMKQAPISLDSWQRFRNELRANSSVYLLPHQSYMLAHKSFRLDDPVELIFAPRLTGRGTGRRARRAMRENPRHGQPGSHRRPIRPAADSEAEHLNVAVAQWLPAGAVVGRDR